MPPGAYQTIRAPRTKTARPRAISWRQGRSTAMTVYGYGIRFFVRRGQLNIEDGFPNEGSRRRLVLSRATCRLQRVVIVAQTGLITLDAAQFLSDLGITVAFVEQGGRLRSVLLPGGMDGRQTILHRQQVFAQNSTVGVEIARYLIGCKLRGQRSVLEWLTDPGRQIPQELRPRIEGMQTAISALFASEEKLVSAHSVEEIVELERRGAEAYWRSLSGLPIRWAPHAARYVPRHWLTTQPRESYRTGNRYGATDPVNCLLNFGYRLLETETRIACLGAGLHPGFGLFHSDKQGNSGFIFDMMEVGRPTVDRLVFDFIRKHQFAEGDCYETREGFCRLDPKITELLTKWMPTLRKVMVPAARRVVVELDLGARLPRSEALQK